jgi:hypothetical protein
MEDNIKITLKEIWWGFVDYIHLTQCREMWLVVVNAATILGLCKRW